MARKKAKLKVKDAIESLKKTISQLEKLPGDLPIMTSFDQGGYGGDFWEPSKFAVTVNFYGKDEIDADYEDDDPDRPEESVSIVAEFYD